MDNDNKYKDGKIYIIRNNTDGSLVYVGSTIRSLAERMSRHRHDCSTDKCKGWLFYRTINASSNYWDDWDISLHSAFPCNSKKELCRREGEIIREIGTLNERIAGRTLKERYNEEKPRLAKQMKEYYDRKQEDILKQKREYYIRNREKIREKSRQRYTNKRRG